MDKELKNLIVSELVSELKLGSTRQDVLKKVAHKWEIPTRTFDRLWKKANIAHNAPHVAKAAILDEVEVEMEVEAKKRDIIAALDRKEYLTKIVRGEILIQKTEVRWDSKQKKFVTIPINELPSHSTRISAISELNRMDGDYAPTKFAKTDPEGGPVKEEVMQIMSDGQVEALFKKYNVKTD